MRKTLGLVALLLVLTVLLIPGRARYINAGNWKIYVAAGFVIAVLVLAVGWIASRERVAESDSVISRLLRRLTSETDD